MYTSVTVVNNMPKRKYSDPRTITIILDREILERLDSIKGQNSRGKFITDLINTKGNEIAEIEAQRNQIEALRDRLNKIQDTA
jgi:predicted CopG family antitoxin